MYENLPFGLENCPTKPVGLKNDSCGHSHFSLACAALKREVLVVNNFFFGEEKIIHKYEY